MHRFAWVAEQVVGGNLIGGQVGFQLPYLAVLRLSRNLARNHCWCRKLGAKPGGSILVIPIRSWARSQSSERLQDNSVVCRGGGYLNNFGELHGGRDLLVRLLVQVHRIFD